MSRLDYCQYELVDDCYDWKNDNCDGCNIFKAYCEGARMAKASIVRCKDCRYYVQDFWGKIGGVPIIMAHNCCTFWGNGCKTDPSGYCSFGELAEQTERREP